METELMCQVAVVFLNSLNHFHLWTKWPESQCDKSNTGISTPAKFFPFPNTDLHFVSVDVWLLPSPLPLPPSPPTLEGMMSSLVRRTIGLLTGEVLHHKSPVIRATVSRLLALVAHRIGTTVPHTFSYTILRMAIP
jgi:hypothetical protein